jgi:hypothetical protein
MDNYTDMLRNITQVLLKDDDNYAELAPAINNLFELFTEASGLNPDDEMNRKDIYLEKGKAIGTSWAAMCVKEILRTKNFIRGLYKGVLAAQHKFPDTKIHILYAGTGPFATLAIPLTTLFTSEEVQFTLLEINPISIELLKKTLKAFNAENYVDQIVQCDATVYNADKSKPIHIILTETMQNALQKEPHVSITMNLVPQLHPDGILIPENIRIDAVLVNPVQNAKRMTDPDWNGEKYYQTLNTIFELNKYTFGSNSAHKISGTDTYEFDEVEVELPAGIDPGYKELSLLTAIKVFDDVELTNYQCSLNLPKKLMNIDQKALPSNRMSFQYVINDKPGFQYKFI